MIESLFSMYEALGSVSDTIKNSFKKLKKERKERKKRKEEKKPAPKL